MEMPRFLGKALTYLGLFLTGAGIIGMVGPHFELQRSGKVMAEVISNEMAYQREGVFAFRLQMRWTKAEGEQRTTLTTPVRAVSEAEAWQKYRGRQYEKGKTYEIFTAASDPDRLEPFKGYNWATFGRWLILFVAGLISFFMGMSMVRKVKAQTQ